MTICLRCGTARRADAPSGLCAGCLLMAGSETFASSALDELPTLTSHGLSHGISDLDPPRPEPGQVWGTYRIGAVLGRGGMGEVYEGEHTESGRRVALKVLRGRLDHADRARFLREGQLAASISHPHTVYIYGSEEIGGMPVITMELLPGGTLKDRVAAEGPLPIDEAVAAVPGWRSWIGRAARSVGPGRWPAWFIAWSPAVAWLVYLLMSPKLQGWVPNPGAPVVSTIVMLGLLAADAATVFLWRGRGVHDRLTGTWVVVR